MELHTISMKCAIYMHTRSTTLGFIGVGNESTDSDKCTANFNNEYWPITAIADPIIGVYTTNCKSALYHYIAEYVTFYARRGHSSQKLILQLHGQG